MKRLLAVLLAVAGLVLLAPGTATAHPLGNFTVNRYAGLEVAGDRVYVRYALDLAEIPTFQLGDQIKKPGYATRLGRELKLTLDGRSAPLRVLEQRVVLGTGAGGLETLRLDVVYEARGEGNELRFEDRAFSGRIGWREITVSARDGARVEGSSAPSFSESDALRAYPKDLLRSPLDVSTATATVTLGDAPGAPPGLDGGVAPQHESGGFEALIERGDFTPGVLLLSLLIAAFWGAAHALTPGHGKAMVAAYLVGTRGKPRHAFILGGTVTVAHTAGVFAIGIVTLALSQFVVPERLYPWLTLVSGLLVVAVGASVLRQRLQRRRGPHHHHHHHPCGSEPQSRRDHSHDHHRHDHHRHDHFDQRHERGGHDHVHDEALTSKGILGVGIAAGLLPCPSALVVLLSAIALHRIGLGLVLILAFSVGLAATITAIGLVAVFARQAFGRLSLDGTLARTLPAVSAALILAVGVVITAKALPGVI